MPPLHCPHDGSAERWLEKSLPRSITNGTMEAAKNLGDFYEKIRKKIRWVTLSLPYLHFFSWCLVLLHSFPIMFMSSLKRSPTGLLLLVLPLPLPPCQCQAHPPASASLPSSMPSSSSAPKSSSSGPSTSQVTWLSSLSYLAFSFEPPLITSGTDLTPDTSNARMLVDELVSWGGVVGGMVGCWKRKCGPKGVRTCVKFIFFLLFFYIRKISVLCSIAAILPTLMPESNNITWINGLVGIQRVHFYEHGRSGLSRYIKFSAQKHWAAFINDPTETLARFMCSQIVDLYMTRINCEARPTYSVIFEILFKEMEKELG